MLEPFIQQISRYCSLVDKAMGSRSSDLPRPFGPCNKYNQEHDRAAPGDELAPFEQSYYEAESPSSTSTPGGIATSSRKRTSSVTVD